MMRKQQPGWDIQHNIEKFLTKMGMNNCNPVKTPMNSGDHFVKANENDESRDQQGYQSLIGSLFT